MGLGLAGKLTVMFGADMKGFDRSMKKAEKNLGKWSRNMKRIGSSMTMNLTLPIVAVGGAAVKMASDFNESLNKTRVAFGKSSKHVEDFAKTTLKNFGLAEGSALEMASLFGDMGTALGFTQGQAADMSTELVGLAGDLASFKNISIGEVQTALAGIFTGETESLKRLGIMTTEATLKNSDYFKSLNKTWKELTNAEKIQVRYHEVLRQTTNAQGDYIRTQDGFANSLRSVQEATKELGANIGQDLIPVAKDLLQVVSKITGWLAGLSEEQRKSLIQWSGLVAISGPVLSFFGILAGVGRTLAWLFGKGGMLRVAIIGLIQLLSKFTPQGWLISGIVTATGLLVTNWDKVKNALFGVTKQQKELNKETKKQISLTRPDDPLGLLNEIFPNVPTKGSQDPNWFLKSMGGKTITPPKTKGKGGTTIITPKKTDLFDIESLYGERAFDESMMNVGNLFNTGVFPQNMIGPQLPTGEELKKHQDAVKKAIQLQDQWNTSVRSFEGAFQSAMESALTSQGNFLENFVNNLKNAFIQIAAQQVSQNISSALFGTALQVGMGASPVGLGMMAMTMFHENRGGLAEGGLATGPTTALIGEGRGTSISNPEVVAPLNKLKQYMGNQGGSMEVSGKLVGTDIFLSNSKTSFHRLRTT